MATSRKSQAKRGTFTALIIFALIAIIGGTYARYSSQSTSNAKLQIAKWNVAFKTNSNVISSENPITFTVAGNSNIAPNRIAPTYSASGLAQIDLTGTEVSVDLSADISAAAIKAAFGANVQDRIDVTLKVNGVKQSSTTIPYATIASNPVIDVEVIVEWTEDDANDATTSNTTENTNDTTLGLAAGTAITIPVTLTATQHVGN